MTLQQVCSMFPLDMSNVNYSESSEEGKIWAQRAAACREAETMQGVYDSCRV